MLTKVITYHLEMTSPSDLRPAQARRDDLALHQAKIPCPELNRFFYTAVGGDWFWIDRLKWTYDQWLKNVNRPEFETWYATAAGSLAGYFELEAQPEQNVEIVHFGLLPQFVGQGIGGWLLTATIERAWQINARRVWVHTCTLDHPKALANYQARGLRLFKEVASEVDLPESSPGPWPGAYVNRN